MNSFPTPLIPANNLSDLPSPSTALANLGAMPQADPVSETYSFTLGGQFSDDDAGGFSWQGGGGVNSNGLLNLNEQPIGFGAGASIQFNGAGGMSFNAYEGFSWYLVGNGSPSGGVDENGNLWLGPGQLQLGNAASLQSDGAGGIVVIGSSSDLSGNGGNIILTPGSGAGGPDGTVQIVRPVVYSLGAAPSNPVAGQLYFDTTLNKLCCFDGTIWQTCWA